MAGTKYDAKEFVQRWRSILEQVPDGKNNEQQDTAKFWQDLLVNVLGVPSSSMATFVDFERKVRGRRIDVFVSDHHFLCEQKSVGVDLDKPEPRNGGLETPYQQAAWYAQHLPYSERPRWLMTCNFETFRLYDLDEERPEDTVQEFSLEELPDHLYLLGFLTSKASSRLHKEQELSVEAGRHVSRLYDAISKQYHHIDTDEEEQRSLNVLITRIIFLLYAEDADLLQSHFAFGDFCKGDPSKLRRKLAALFETIDTPYDKRDEYADDDVAAFPYVNGGLFSDQSIVIPQMTEEIADAIEDASRGFDWREISGVIFGGVFEGTLNPETRHARGMHYTSVENIERCLRPLFLDELWAELHAAEGERSGAKRQQMLEALHDKISKITIGDPACGSGNFLTEAYRQLRTIENRIIEDEHGDQTALFGVLDNPIRVSLDQFYGIEINDFAVSVAKTALWITEEQMLRKTQEILPGYQFDFLPLRNLDNLREGNALTTDWAEVFPTDLTYLVGNPPFLGSSVRTREQTSDLEYVFASEKKWGKCDYCVGWYKKAADFMKGKDCHACLVSTNSITQGEQVEPTWKRLFDDGVVINFAYRSFIWDNEAADKAHVHCVIIGFSYDAHGSRKLFYPDGAVKTVSNINGYLSAAPNVFIAGRGKPLNPGMPPMVQGCKPVDGGNLVLSPEEKDELISRYPELSEVIHPYYGAREFINNIDRYCLWFEGVDITRYAFPEITERLNAVRASRAASPTKAFREGADTPFLFIERRKPTSSYLAFPEVSSAGREILPIGYLGPEVVPSNQLHFIPTDSLFAFGMLASKMHMAWVKTVAGRLKSDYRYNPSVYNSFIFPECDADRRAEVESAVRGVLDARSNHPDDSLAKMYSPSNAVFYPDLMRAHKALDAAVEAAYGVDFNGDEEKIVAHLFKLYAEKVGE